MKKTGFTLIELLAVIVILSIIAVIVVPNIAQMIKNSQESSYQEQKSAIISAAKRWSTDNALKLPTTNGESIEKSVYDLKEEGYLNSEKDIIDPRDNNEMNGCAKITYDESNNQYKYTYEENCEEK